MGGLHWSHPDIFDWIHSKDWSEEIRAAKAKDYNTPAQLDMTNISVILDTEFFDAYSDINHDNHNLAKEVYWETVSSMIKSGEPGFSIDAYDNEGENLRNAPIAGSTHVLTDSGYKKVIDIVGKPQNIWTGTRFAKHT